MPDDMNQSVVNHARNDLANDIPGRMQPPQREGTLREMLGSAKEAWDGLRIGDGHAAGMMRLGAHELTQALAAFPDSNIRPMEEPGVFGNPTPQIVTQEMGGPQFGVNDMPQGPTIHGPSDGKDTAPAIEDSHQAIQAPAQQQEHTPEQYTPGKYVAALQQERGQEQEMSR